MPQSSSKAAGTGATSSRGRYVDHDTFDEMGPDHYYWLGFIFTDGCVYRIRNGKTPTVSVCLAEVDRPHIEKWRSFVKSEHKISSWSKGPYLGAIHRFSSIKIGQFIEDLGRYTPEIAEDLLHSRDFWRGAVDGDGCLYTNPKKGPSVSFVGRQEMVEGFLRHLQEDADIDTNATAQKVKDKNFYQTQIGGRYLATKVIRHLYKEDDVTYLDRKMVKSQQILKDYQI
jgi:hypothetical protein